MLSHELLNAVAAERENSKFANKHDGRVEYYDGGGRHAKGWADDDITSQ
jgi:hypothetical protein